jgi:hypothetical protein
MVVVGHGTSDATSVEVGFTNDQRIYCRIANQSLQTSARWHAPGTTSRVATTQLHAA